MTDFPVHTPASAPDASKDLLEHSKKLYGGMVPNLHGVMAEAPALLEAYQALNTIFDKTSLTNIERNIVWLAVNYENGCTYCMAAHTAVALHAGLDQTDVDAMRDNTPLSDNKLEALRRFTVHMVQQRGWAAPEEIDALMAAGYTRSTVLEVVLGIGMKTLSNYTNHVAATPVDKPFEKFAWEK